MLLTFGRVNNIFNMKKVVFLLGFIFLFAGNGFSRSADDPLRDIELFGEMGLVRSGAIRASVGNNTLVATFNKEMKDVRVIVSGKTGEVVFEQEMDVQPLEQLPVYLPNYEKGTYRVEIITPEGEVEGEF